MRQSRIKKLYIRRCIESLNNTPEEAKELIKNLESISGVKKGDIHIKNK